MMISSPARFSFAFLSVVMFFGFLYADEPPDSAKFVIHAVKIPNDIRMTGKMDDPQWMLATPVPVDVEITPGENVPATVRTTARILYTDQKIYLGFDCRDSHPSEIRAHVTDRDKCFDDDFMIAIIDTYGDYQRAYEFVINPYGIQADLLRTGNNEDASFDAVWESAAAIDSDGWTAEMAIPFKSLRFPSKPEQHWLVDFLRNYPRTNRVQISWVPVDRNNPCLLCQSGVIEGLRDVQAAGSSVDLLPYVLGQQSGSLNDQSDPQSPFENGKITGRAGGGLRYAPTPDLAVEGVVNPDFSQVESDATQISINSNYALFYPEKRPFFLLGADMFQNTTQTFYSRTINNPLAAARVIGKSGSLSFAYLAASDRNTPFIIPGEETSDDTATNLKSFSNVARLRYDFGGETFLGGTIITRNTGASAHNYLGGIDWKYKFLENYYFTGEAFYADTREVNDIGVFSNPRMFGSTGYNAAFNGEHYSGTSTMLKLQRNARNYSVGLQYLDRGPTFQAQDGFVPNNDLRELFLNQEYDFYPNGSLVSLWGLTMNGGLHYNYDGVWKETWAMPGVFMQLNGQTNVNVEYFAVNNELYHSVTFDRINRAELSVNSRPSTYLSLYFDGSFGRFIKRSDPVDMGTGHTISLEADLKPTSRLEIDLTYERSRLSSLATGELFYDGYITRGTGIFQFTREIFLRLIGQYDGFNKVFDVYPLLSYKLNAYTIFYAGSTYSLYDFADPFGFRTTTHQYFLKIQYLIRS